MQQCHRAIAVGIHLKYYYYRRMQIIQKTEMRAKATSYGARYEQREYAKKKELAKIVSIFDMRSIKWWQFFFFRVATIQLFDFTQINFKRKTKEEEEQKKSKQTDK